MRLFELIKIKYDEFNYSVSEYLSKTLSNFRENYGVNSIFGQLVTVTNGVVQNIISYIEDALVEQNKYTAQRRKSIYSLAQFTGYNPHLGKAAVCNIKLTIKPNNSDELNLILNNKSTVICTQNGLTYNIVLPQESIILNSNNNSKYLMCVEGKFETQRFISNGGQLYTKNILLNGDIDIDFLEVKVNNKKWERITSNSIYDMAPDGEQYICKTSLNKGIDLIFGNNQFGRQLKDGDEVEVSYLLHSGELGNINENEECNFVFEENLTNLLGEEVNGNELYNIILASENGITSGTYAEGIGQVGEMIGFNSRAMVLADPKNYKQFINKFSFCGYNRTWCEEGSLVVNSLIMKNYKLQLKSGLDYFSLKDNDFLLSENQKDVIINNIINSGQQLAGTVFNIFEPELCKYVIYCYIKMKEVSYDKNFIENRIKTLIGEFFSNIQSDIFIPKSDVIQLLKNSIDEIDSVDIYFMSKKNEEAMINGYYNKNNYIYNPSKGTYDLTKETIYIYGDEEPGIGLDEHGNIYLDDNSQFPVIMAGWSYRSTNDTTIAVLDPLTIIFE